MVFPGFAPDMPQPFPDFPCLEFTMEQLDPTLATTTLPEAQQPATPAVATDDEDDFLAGKKGYCELGEACESCQ